MNGTHPPVSVELPDGIGGSGKEFFFPLAGKEIRLESCVEWICRKCMGEVEAQVCQVMVQEQAGKPSWEHNSFQTIDDGHPDLDDRFVPIQREFESDSVGMSWVK